MDNPNPPISKPLGYDAMKAVIKSMSVEKRQALHTHIPQLRKTNSLVPYNIEKVSFAYNYIEINNKRWTFVTEAGINGRLNNLKANDVVNLELELASEPDSMRPNETRHFQLNKPFEEVYSKVVDAYLQNGVVIEKLYIGTNYHDFFNKRNPENWKMKVSRISFHYALDYETMVPFLDLSQLECVNFPIQDDTLKTFERLEIINCKKLVLNACLLFHSNYDPVKNFLLKLKSPHEISMPPAFLVEDILKEWVKSPRPIGTRLTMPCRHHILLTFDEIQHDLETVLAEHPRKEEATECRSMKMSDGNRLIFHHVEEPPRLEIEVFEGVKPTEDVKDEETSEKRVRQQ